MPAGKIKNLILVILLLANCFLLILVVPTRWESARRAATESAKLTELFSRSDVRLQEESIPETRSTYPMRLSCTSTDKIESLQIFLGKELLAQEDSYHTEYKTARGTCTLDGLAFSVVLDQALEDVSTLLDQFGGQWTISEPFAQKDNTESYSCNAFYKDLPLWGAGMNLECRDGKWHRASGTLLPTKAVPMRASGEVCCTAQDALVTFWGSRLTIGWVGTEILSVQQGYLVTSSGLSAAQFTPSWKIVTDAGNYLVDGITKNVSIFPEL